MASLKFFNDAQTFWNRLIMPNPTMNTTITVPERTFTVAGVDDVGNVLNYGAGAVIQVANYTTGAYQACTTLIPFDNTVPLVTEGDQFLSISFTPKKATSKLRIDINTYLSNSNSGATGTIAVFRDSGIVPLGVSITALSAGQIMNESLTIFTDAVSTTPTTFKARTGGNVGTQYVNGHSGAGIFGGSLASSITITEIAQ